jgi:hypothetical protein
MRDMRPCNAIPALIRERHTKATAPRETRGRVYNLGEGGFFIEMPDPPAKGTILEVEVSGPGRAAKRFLAIVRWREKLGRSAGVGVRFAPIGNDERDTLARLVSSDVNPRQQAAGRDRPGIKSGPLLSGRQ